MSKPKKRAGPTRQALFNRRQRKLRRMFGVCQNCGKKHPGTTYCGRNAEARRRYMRELMRRRREKLRGES